MRAKDIACYVVIDFYLARPLFRQTLIHSDKFSSLQKQTDYMYTQEGLAVASIARDDPSPLPGMHRDHIALPSQTDGQTDRQTNGH